jgi:hypothetical protein
MIQPSQRTHTIHFPAEAALRHHQAVANQWHFCGWIPIECPICFAQGIAPVYLAPLPQPFSPVFALCLHCSVMVDWDARFALLAQSLSEFTADVELPRNAPGWLETRGISRPDETVRGFLVANVISPGQEMLDHGETERVRQHLRHVMHRLAAPTPLERFLDSVRRVVGRLERRTRDLLRRSGASVLPARIGIMLGLCERPEITVWICAHCGHPNPVSRDTCAKCLRPA